MHEWLNLFDSLPADEQRRRMEAAKSETEAGTRPATQQQLTALVNSYTKR